MPLRSRLDNVLINHFVVYPETKGVPLEEMDAVFGEGPCYMTHWMASLITFIDPHQPYLENESETTSLMIGGSSHHGSDIERLRFSTSRDGGDGEEKFLWLRKLFRRQKTTHYEPITPSEDY